VVEPPPERSGSGGGYIPPHPDVDLDRGNSIREALGLKVGAPMWIDLFDSDDTVEGTFQRVLWHENSGPVAVTWDLATDVGPFTLAHRDLLISPWRSVFGLPHYLKDRT
jgi:hypothetical protein